MGRPSVTGRRPVHLQVSLKFFQQLPVSFRVRLLLGLEREGRGAAGAAGTGILILWPGKDDDN